MSKKILKSGTPPVVWSVFDRVVADSNSNFSELYLENELVKQTLKPLVDKNIETSITGSVRNNNRVVLDSDLGMLFGNVTGDFVTVGEIKSPAQLKASSPEVVIQSLVTDIQSTTVKFSNNSTVHLSLSQLSIEDSVKSVVVADRGKLSLVPVSELILDSSIPIFKVAADDSTQRLIHYEETVKFLGINGIKVYSNNEGEIQIDGIGVKLQHEYISLSTGVSTVQVNLGETVLVEGANGISASIVGNKLVIDGQGLQQDTRNESRVSVSVTTEMLMPNQTSFVNVTGFYGYVLYKVQTSSPAWVRVYSNSNNRSLDSTRLIEVDPSHTAGVVTEVVTTSSQPVAVVPGVIGFNDEFPITNDIPLAVTNTTSTPRSITVTLTILQIEA